MPAGAPCSRPWWALLPLLAGLVWLSAGSGFFWWLFAAVPGVLLITASAAPLLQLSGARAYGLMAVAAVLGTLLSVPAGFAGGFGAALCCGLLSAASLLVSGRLSWRNEVPQAGGQAIEPSLLMDFKAGLDEAMLGYFAFTARIPGGEQAERMCDEADALEQAFEAEKWLDDPRGLNPRPPAPESSFVTRARSLGHEFEAVRFDSGFALPGALPGAGRWNAYNANAVCHMRVLRHPGAPRPWLFCIHGYRMGIPWMDLALFRPEWLHHHLGLNLIQPVLPLHGPRREGWRSGDHFLDGDPFNLVYAEMHALWDLRRALAWLRQSEGEVQVGVLGYSLGGYNAALLAAYESSLAFVVAAIPVADFASMLWRVLPPDHLRFFESRGMDEARYRRLLQTVSPLQLPPAVERERLHVVAGAGDRLVPPAQALALSAHWQRPVDWFQGSHMSVGNERLPRAVLAQAMRGAGWADAAGQ